MACRKRQAVLRAGRRRHCRPRTVWSTREISALGAGAVRSGARGAGLGRASAARRPSPPDADRGRRAWARTSSPIACSGWKTRRRPRTRQSFRLIRQHTTTPLAVGEVFNSIWDCKQLIEEQLIDYIRTTVVHAGGITHLRRIADLGRPLSGAHRLPWRHRPVAGLHGRGAALRHLDPQLRHPGIHAPHRGDRRGLPACLQLQATARCIRARRPATGVDIDENLAAKYPYRPASLPINRLEDGTMHNW